MEEVDVHEPSESFSNSEVACRRLNYNVPIKFNRTKVLRRVLVDVSTVFGPGLNAILGPTGSGKTSLLEILAGRNTASGIEGDVYFNRKRIPPDFRYMVGFVPQNDIMFGTLTVRENIHFSALLRSKVSTRLELESLVNDVIDTLGLGAVANQKVGSTMIKGISGGEKRRASIGMELVVGSPVLFLDEPTSGLDAATALSVTLALKVLADRGRTVVFTIHQPRYSMFKMFNQILLLSNGQVLYCGSREAALPYFDRLGFKCEEFNNPADFLLDVVRLDDAAICYATTTLEEIKGPSSNIGPVHLAASYKESEQYSDVTQRFSSTSWSQEPALTRSHTSNFFWKLFILCRRALTNTLRNPKNITFLIFQNLVYAVILGLIYYQLDKGPSGLQNRIGATYMVASSMVFGNMGAVETFLSEREIFVNEYKSGYYSAAAYFLAKVLFDLIPLRLVANLIFSAIIYFMMGFVITLGKYAMFFVGTLIGSMVSTAVVFTYSAFAPNQGIAALMTSFTFLIMLIFGGFVLNLKTLAKGISWLQYISVFGHLTNIILVNELEGMVFDCGNSTSNRIPCMTGDQYLESQGYSRGGVAQSFYILLGLMTFFLIMTYLLLLRRARRS